MERQLPIIIKPNLQGCFLTQKAFIRPSDTILKEFPVRQEFPQTRTTEYHVMFQKKTHWLLQATEHAFLWCHFPANND